MALNSGDTLLNGQYCILRLLGRGGFGFVYQASDTLLERDVAIKELILGLVGDEVMLKRFLVEAHGGSIEVASTVGQGTCSTLLLPAVKACTSHNKERGLWLPLVHT